MHKWWVYFIVGNWKVKERSLSQKCLKNPPILFSILQATVGVDARDVPERRGAVALLPPVPPGEQPIRPRPLLRQVNTILVMSCRRRIKSHHYFINYYNNFVKIAKFLSLEILAHLVIYIQFYFKIFQFTQDFWFWFSISNSWISGEYLAEITNWYQAYEWWCFFLL